MAGVDGTNFVGSDTISMRFALASGGVPGTRARTQRNPSRSELKKPGYVPNRANM